MKSRTNIRFGPFETDPAAGDLRKNGNPLYFSSERDGHACIYAHRVDPETKTPVGEPFEVYGFYETTPTLAGRSRGFWLSAAPGKFVFTIARTTGNVWMLEPMENGSE